MNILHLSDLHIGCTYDYTGLIGQKLIMGLKTYKEDCNKKIDEIVVTGDIFDSSSDNEELGKEGKLRKDVRLNKALYFFDYLCSEIQKRDLGNVNKANILFVPGNHDVCRDGKEEPWELYKNFLQKFYESANMTFDKPNFMVVKEDNENKILFLGFNSNYYEKTGNEYKECVDYEQIDVVDDLLKKNKKYMDYYKIAFFHHPFYIFPENIKDEKKGTLTNLTEFTDRIGQWGIKLVLHGHKHLGGMRLIKTRGAKIKAVAAGSLGYYGAQSHSFNIVEINEHFEEELKRYVSRQNREFELDRKFGMKKNNKTGLLCDIYHDQMYEDNNTERNAVLNMLNKLYINQEPLNLLKDKECSEFLYNCIDYRIRYRRFSMPEASDFLKIYYHRGRDGIIWNELETLLEKVELEKYYIDSEKEEELEKERNIDEKRLFSYALMAVFFTDLYLDFTEFWSQNIKDRDVDCKRIDFRKKGIKYSPKYQCVYICLICRDIKSYKSAVETVNKYRDFFHKINKYFDCIKLKIKDIQPDFYNDNDINISYHNFDASVPKLIPLLTGTNIYSSDLVFVRELIQNSIDAVAFRESRGKNNCDLKKCILVDVGHDVSGNFFRIRDYGIGMDESIVERYFSTLGKSYYKEYSNLKENKTEYNAISNFGIGFLSVFKLCKKIIVKTKYYMRDQNKEEAHFKFEVREYGCFMLGRLDKEFETGTEITCYFEETDQNVIEQRYNDINRYIHEKMLDVKYDIVLSKNGEKDETILSRSIRRDVSRLILYIPFNEDAAGDEYKIDILDQGELNFQLIKNCRHGLLICFAEENNSEKKIKILNAGILMENAKLEHILSHTADDMDLKFRNIEIFFNFPPNWLCIDMSREKAEKINEVYIKENIFKERVYESLRNQLDFYMKNHQDTKLAVVYEIEKFMEKYFLDKESEKRKIFHAFTLDILYKKESIVFRLKKRDPNELFCRYICKRYRDEKGEMLDQPPVQRYFEESVILEDFRVVMDCLNRNDSDDIIESFVNKLGFSFVEKDKFWGVLAACLPQGRTNDSEWDAYDKWVDRKILETYRLEDLDKEELFAINYGVENNKIKMESDDLQDIIDRIAEEYGSNKGINKYEFIWEKIIKENYFEKCFSNKEDGSWERIKEEGKKEYIYLRNLMKRLYSSGGIEGAKLDIYMIASCHMGALYNLLGKKMSEKKENVSVQEIFERVWDCGTELVSMWNMAECKPMEGGPLADFVQYNDLTEKRRLKKEKGLDQFKEKEWLKSDGNEKYSKREIYKKYTQMMQLKYSYSWKYDALYIAELLYWYTEYK